MPRCHLRRRGKEFIGGDRQIRATGCVGGRAISRGSAGELELVCMEGKVAASLSGIDSITRLIVRGESCGESTVPRQPLVLVAPNAAALLRHAPGPSRFQTKATTTKEQ